MQPEQQEQVELLFDDLNEQMCIMTGQELSKPLLDGWSSQDVINFFDSDGLQLPGQAASTSAAPHSTEIPAAAGDGLKNLHQLRDGAALTAKARTEHASRADIEARWEAEELAAIERETATLIAIEKAEREAELASWERSRAVAAQQRQQKHMAQQESNRQFLAEAAAKGMTPLQAKIAMKKVAAEAAVMEREKELATLKEHQKRTKQLLEQKLRADEIRLAQVRQSEIDREDDDHLEMFL